MDATGNAGVVLKRGAVAWAALVILAASGFVAAGLWLRVADLGERSLHADESTGARIVGHRLDDNRYQFDPTHFHGPLLTSAAAAWCSWRGEDGWDALRAETLRQVTAWCGVGAVLLAGAIAGGGWRRLIVMALVSTSPLLIYYSRMFIHEPLLVFFCALGLAGVAGVAGVAGAVGGTGSRWRAALVVGVALGGMAVTRETFVVTVFAWTVASALWAWRAGVGAGGAWRGIASAWWRPALVALAVPAVIVSWFYSSGGENPGGVVDFFRTYFSYQTGEGHGKPWFYYLHVLVWPGFRAGRWWTEGALLLIALSACLPAAAGHRLTLRARFLLEAGLLHLGVFSMIGYKTPWLSMAGWFHVALAAGCALIVWGDRLRGGWRFIPGLVLLLVLVFHQRQAILVTGRLATDARNPYAYVPTSRDVESVAPLLRELKAMTPDAPPLAVVGSQYWPLPWYLRGLGPVGYWTAWEGKLADYPVLLVLPTADGAPEALASSHVLIPKGLRDDFPVFIAVGKPLWDRYLNTPETGDGHE